MLYRTTDRARTALSGHWRWPHFSIGELACHCGGRFCGGEYWHDPAFLDALEALRTEMGGRALVLHSGHRCAGWNAAVGGAPRSQHKQIAADIRIAGHDRFRLLAGAEQTGFTGLGLAKSFLHVDRRARPARWYYPGSETLWKR
ncbi:D-Ala-D-Ala carboxypeptidase family metallohydrolase [Henriciella aquimarina]|uniref:D-Ala-D-Ala carboxypeptidase family metallohydrolase n=1 Tax=Henriciella aquimarina TaxID=545261 RepID=UPI000A015254|nr:D-Ala-D-Ala carboxypeptidase family metallohydrolase [Henriciella aquimarina]